MLSGCHISQTAHTHTVSPPKQESILVLPISDISLPNTDFIFTFPSQPELNKPTSPRKDITENFSTNELADVAVPDPKLMSENNSLIIDLGAIQKDDFAFPLPGAKVISPYAGRRKFHSGVDLKTCANDTIVSAFDGIVRMAKPYAAYGNIIVVRHYNGLETLYSHNSKNFVKPGDRVKAGQPIALTGRTGRATTEHLHFEVRANGQHFNPSMVFNLVNEKLNDQCLVITQKGNNIAVKSIELMPHQLAGAYTYSTSSNKENQKESI